MTGYFLGLLLAITLSQFVWIALEIRREKKDRAAYRAQREEYLRRIGELLATAKQQE